MDVREDKVRPIEGKWFDPILFSDKISEFEKAKFLRKIKENIVLNQFESPIASRIWPIHTMVVISMARVGTFLNMKNWTG